MDIKNKEFLINYLDNIYELIGKFDTILDVLKLLCIGKTDRVKEITDSLRKVLDDADKLLDNLRECSDYIDESLLAANNLDDTESKQSIYDNNIKLIGLNEKIIKKVKDILAIVDICNIYSYLILGEQAPNGLNDLKEKASKLRKEKSTDEIFEDLMADIKENILDLSDITKEILWLNNK